MRDYKELYREVKGQRPRIYVDMDGVLCDFIAQSKKATGKIFTQDKAKEYSHQENSKILVWHVHGRANSIITLNNIIHILSITQLGILCIRKLGWKNVEYRQTELINKTSWETKICYEKWHKTTAIRLMIALEI